MTYVIIGLLLVQLAGFLTMRKILSVLKKRKKKTMGEIYVDYVNEEKGLVIRVFPNAYEVDALNGLSSSKIVDAGAIDGEIAQSKFYLYEL
jgi:hypothetical protein